VALSTGPHGILPSPLRHALLLIACLAAALPLQAEEIWRIDSPPSAGRFKVRLLAMLSITGRFDRVDGKVAIDRADRTARVEATIDETTVKLRTERQTRWARSPEFFDTARHPGIRFVSQRLPLDRLASGGVLEGRLELRGIAREVRFQIAPSDCGAVEAKPCEVEVEGAIRRSDFGMRTRRGALSDRVELEFSIVAVPG
jgi:polyisoprenoid-binding protein YceI